MPENTEQLQRELHDQIAAITARYKPEIDQLQAEGEAMQDDFENPSTPGMMIGVDFDVSWKDHELIFDVPQFTMREKRIGLDLPTIIADRQRIVFHTPSVRMVPRVIARIPQFRGLGTIKWKDVITHVPEPFMQKQEIIFDLPSVRMDRQDIILHLPEVSMGQIRWVLRLPEFVLRNVRAETTALKEKGEALKKRGEDLAARMRAEIETAAETFKARLMQEALAAKQTVTGAYDSAINTMNTGIVDLQKRGVDPIKVPTDAGEVNLRKQVAQVVEERDRAMAELDAAAAAISPPSEPVLAEAA